jgi:hypothetical protein
VSDSGPAPPRWRRDGSPRAAGGARKGSRDQKPMEGTSVIARQREMAQRTRRWSKTLKSAGAVHLACPAAAMGGQTEPIAGAIDTSSSPRSGRPNRRSSNVILRETGGLTRDMRIEPRPDPAEPWSGERGAVSAGRSHRLDGAEVPRPGVRERSRALDPSASTRRRASGGNPEALVRTVRRTVRDGGSIRSPGRKCPEQPGSRWILCDAAPRLDLGRGLRGTHRPAGGNIGAEQSRASAREGRRRRRTAGG